MTTKKLLIILIASVLSALTIGLTAFFVSNKDKSIYATSISASQNSIDMYVGDELYIMNTIDFEIKPTNCTQSIKFSISDISICSLDTGTRKIKAKKEGSSTLRASIKSASNKYISTDILINVFEQNEPNETYATNVTKKKDNVILRIGETIAVEQIFVVLPQNCTQTADVLFDLPNVCEFDAIANEVVATNKGVCVATAKVKSGEGESDFVTNQINIIVCESQSVHNFEKSMTFENDKNNIFVLNIAEDLPELLGFGKIDFDISHDNNLEILDPEINIYKILCKSSGVFEVVFENSGYKLVYHLSATLPNLLLNAKIKTEQISMQIGDTFDLGQIEFEDLPSDYQIQFSSSNQNATIQNNALLATNVGNCVLTATVTANESQRQFNVAVSISKRIVNYQASAKLNQEHIEIDLLQDDVTKTIAPTFSIQDITIENEEVVAKENLSNGILTLLLLDKGNTTIGINSEKVEIIINISVK